MKLKFSLIAIALLGLMTAMPTAGHANETAPQSGTRVLTNQEMQEVSGAGKSCNYKMPGCGTPCTTPNSVGIVYKNQPFKYAVCGTSFGWDTCADDSEVRCAEYRSWGIADPFKCASGGSFIRTETLPGCGTVNAMDGTIEEVE